MAKIKRHNMLSKLPGAKRREVFQTLARGQGFKIERIISRGQTTPQGTWLCSKADEWVAVLQGRARLLFKGDRAPVELYPGDSVLIRAHVPHRVAWTDPRQRTVWLAVHILRQAKRREGSR